VVSDSTTPRRPVLTLDDLAPLSRRPERIYALTASDLAVAFSQALDLAEGKPVGHAQRVCYIAMLLADRLDLDPQQRQGVFFGALLHDIGVTLAASDICRVAGVDEETVFGPSPARSPDDRRGELPFADTGAILDSFHQHCALGAESVRALDLADEAVAAVASHHERWDGTGVPKGISGERVAVEARVVAAADLAEVLIARQPNSLFARRGFAESLDEHAGGALDPRIVACLLRLTRDDEFWLGLHSADLAETLANVRCHGDQRRGRKRLMRFAEVMADIADAKGGHTVGHSRKTADGACKLAEALQLDSAHIEMIRIAALLHDIGLLGVPARVMSKPDILSVTEMQLMRQHPAHSEMVLQSLAGFEEIAFWISRHHERPDGKGYPDMLSGDDVPLESRIIAVADVYAALTAERPHRGALTGRDATQVLLGAAGTQLDPELVRTFVTLI
jgi:putative nucleotidyltransferase with HDIG domain